MRLILATGATFLGAALVLTAAPANDAFADRTELIGTNLVVTASNVGATRESGEPDHVGRTGGSSVWWTWRAPAAGDVVVSTGGSSFDTVIAIYVGSAMSDLQVISGNDNNGALTTSQARFQAAQGTRYQLVVDGLSGASGQINLTLILHSPPGSKPGNDSFVNRALLTGVPVRATRSNLNATRELGEPFHAGQFGATSVWWKWTAPSTGAYKISTADSGFNTLLAVYAGTVLGNLAVVAGNDDADPGGGIRTGEVTFGAAAGQTYAIAVDGFDGAMGSIVLSLDLAAPRLFDPVLEKDTFRVSLQTATGMTYYLEHNNSVSDANWTRLPGVAGNGSVMALTNAAVAGPARFYRIAVE